jgi:hypothetical protein
MTVADVVDDAMHVALVAVDAEVAVVVRVTTALKANVLTTKTLTHFPAM